MQTLRVMFSWCQWCLVWVRNSLYKYLQNSESWLCPLLYISTYVLLPQDCWHTPHFLIGCTLVSQSSPTTSCTPPKSPLFTYAMIVFWLAMQSLHTTLPKGCNLHKYCCWLVLILSLNHIIFIFLYLTPPPPKKTQALYFLFFLIYTDVFLWPAQHPSSHLKSLSYLSNNVFCFTYPDFVFWPAPLDSHIESVCSHGCKIKDRNYFCVRPKNTNVCSELPKKSTRNVFDEVLQLIRHQPCTHTQCFTSICWTQPLRSQKKFGGI